MLSTKRRMTLPDASLDSRNESLTALKFKYANKHPPTAMTIPKALIQCGGVGDSSTSVGSGAVISGSGVIFLSPCSSREEGVTEKAARQMGSSIKRRISHV